MRLSPASWRFVEPILMKESLEGRARRKRGLILLIRTEICRVRGFVHLDPHRDDRGFHPGDQIGKTPWLLSGMGIRSFRAGYPRRQVGIIQRPSKGDDGADAGDGSKQNQTLSRENP